MSDIVIECHHCNGTGIDPITQETCSFCGGDGEITAIGFHQITRYSAVDIRNKIIRLYLTDDVFPSYKIIEAIDDNEYDELNTSQKNTLSLILSCGFVDLAEGTQIRDKLWTMFGEGTTTRQNLEALLEE
jgi:hypothetical protein